MSELVSIVLPTYNGSRFIEESIESVLSQTYTNWELIIVNDASTDNTAEIIEKYAQKDERIKIITNKENKTLPASLNLGFKLARGNYYTWTSDDNVYKPESIEYMADYLDKHSETDLISCDFDYIDEAGDIKGQFDPLQNRNVLELTKRCNIGACFMYRKSIAQKVGEYENDMFCAEDFDYWCRMALVGNIDYSSKNLYKYRKSSCSLTATKQDIIQKKGVEIRLKYAVAIMKKYKLSKSEIIKKLFEFYFQKKNKEWLKLAFRTAPFLCGKEILKLKWADFYNNFIFQLNLNNPKYKRIVFWGASKFLEEYINKYNLKNKKITGIIDKNAEKSGQKLGIYKIFAPEDISVLNPDLIIITIVNSPQKCMDEVQNYIKTNYSKDINIKTYIN